MKNSNLLKIIFFFIATSAIYTAQAQESFTLEQCIKIAFKNNLQLKQVEINEKISKINHKAAYNKLLPSANGRASNTYSWGRGIDPTTNNFVETQFTAYSGSLNSSLLLFNGFANLNAIKITKNDIDINKETVQQIKNDITIDIATRFTNNLYYNELIKANEAQLIMTNQQLEIITLKFDSGVIPESEVYKNKSQIADEELTLINSKNLLLANDLELKQILNFPYNKELILVPLVNDSMESLEFTKSNLLYSLDYHITHNPKYLISKLNEEKSKTTIALTKAAILPTLSTSFSYGSNFNQNNLYFDTNEQISNNKNYGLYFNLAIPIFNQFQTTAKIRTSKLNYELSKVNTEIEKYNLTKELLKSIDNTKSFFKKYQASKIAYEFSLKNYEADKLKLTLGKINSTELGLSKNSYINNNALLIKAKYEYLFNLSLLKFYLGEAFVL